MQYKVPLCVVGALGSGGGDWCSHDSGYSTITDSHGYPRSVYVSARRDGSVWLRFGRDHASLDWTYVDERRARLQSVILRDDDLTLLRVSWFRRVCVGLRYLDQLWICSTTSCATCCKTCSLSYNLLYSKLYNRSKQIEANSKSHNKLDNYPQLIEVMESLARKTL